MVNNVKTVSEKEKNFIKPASFICIEEYKNPNDGMLTIYQLLENYNVSYEEYAATISDLGLSDSIFIFQEKMEQYRKKFLFNTIQQNKYVLLEQWIKLEQYLCKKLEIIKPLHSNEEWKNILEDSEELPEELFLLMKETIEKFRLVSNIYWFGLDKTWSIWRFEHDAIMFNWWGPKGLMERQR